MTDTRTRLSQIQAEQQRQGEILDRILEALQQPLSPYELDDLIGKTMGKFEERKVTAGIAQPPKQRTQ